MSNTIKKSFWLFVCFYKKSYIMKNTSLKNKSMNWIIFYLCHVNTIRCAYFLIFRLSVIILEISFDHNVHLFFILFLIRQTIQINRSANKNGTNHKHPSDLKLKNKISHNSTDNNWDRTSKALQNIVSVLNHHRHQQFMTFAMNLEKRSFLEVAVCKEYLKLFDDGAYRNKSFVCFKKRNLQLMKQRGFRCKPPWPCKY